MTACVWWVTESADRILVRTVIESLSDGLIFRFAPPLRMWRPPREHSPATTISCCAMKQIKPTGFIAQATERCRDEISNATRKERQRAFDSGAARSAIQQT